MMRARPARAVAFGAGVFLLAWILLVATRAPVAAATIAGHVYTAENPDSVAKGAAVTLTRHGAGAGAGMKDLVAQTDAEGHFHFLDLPPDTSITYVLQIRYSGRDFESNPIRFTSGGDQVDYNVLLTDRPPGGEPVQEQAQDPMIPPAIGRPAPQSAFRTILVVLWILLIFATFAMLARRRDSARREGELPAEARSLVREIAGLDVRHGEGTIGDEEYRKVRVALVERLRSSASRVIEPRGRTGQAG